ncbi:hypothetical protein GCM10008090_11360 [Arenicella chitinivorans]|uniref:G8 domain-containing protein n=1 Tax=Arenicella chitinivorans TaxID=1329800 RepID=A0A918RKQ3_9GAMM|nr:G8 domain-containing protein [Arenicella chitinivorans]GHA03845.1 hypothetical protein GCM10008090_11360 [Arenicella chitinivorans]
MVRLSGSLSYFVYYTPQATCTVKWARFALKRCVLAGSLICASYVSAVLANELHQKHEAVLALLLPEQATHTAINSGDWTDPQVWSSGSVPSAEANVYIPEGRLIRYDANSSVALSVVRVDGRLSFDHTSNTKLVLQSLITSMASELEIGTVTNPIQPDKKAELIFADVPINKTVDPGQFGNGLVATGKVQIHGASKLPYTTLKSPALAGSNTLQLNGDLSTWQIGDELLIVGTNGESKAEDELRQIVSIDANGMATLDAALTFNHITPLGHSNLNLYVANTTRNIRLSSENPSGARGHAMFMNKYTDIRFAEFAGLGRTDKSIPLDADGIALDGSDNISGRYSIHFHELGVGENAALAVAYGNSIHDNPGWGITHHSSHAAIDYNVVFNIKGAGIAAEDGNETGQWVGNLVTDVYGDGENPTVNRDEKLGDFGHSGEAYSSTARSLLQKDNIAANANYGWKFTGLQELASFDRFDSTLDPFNPTPLLPIAAGTSGNLIGFHGNTAIAVGIALDSGHRRGYSLTSDVRSDIVDFTAWQVTGHAIDFFSYTADYIIKDSLLIGSESGAGSAVKMTKKSEGTSLIDVHIENFRTGINDTGLNNLGEYVNVSFSNNNTNLKAPFYGTEVDGRMFDHPFKTTNDVNLNQTPEIVLSAQSDLTLAPNDDKVFVDGTITDSMGDYALGENVWLSQKNGVYFIENYELGYTNNSDKGIATNILDDGGYVPAEKLLEMHGALQKPNGDWVIEVVVWVTDRFTAKHTPIVIELQLSGFTDAFLSQFQTEAKQPDGTLTYIDVLSGNVLDFDGNVVDTPDVGDPGNPGPPPVTPPSLPPREVTESNMSPVIYLLLDED